ncbi:hypothetical protein SAMN05660485_01619 [Blastococcus fimeti]|nr:hypothetical protein SAMN05660485_01619 [Blastococcus fimeti]
MTTLAPRPAAVLHDRTVVPLLGRAAALLALGSAAVHLFLVDVGTLGSLAMLGMALVCLPCAWHLWRTPTGSTWAATAGLDAAMLALHAQMLAPQAGHAHAAGSAPTAMWPGLGLVAGQLALASVAGLVALRR